MSPSVSWKRRLLSVAFWSIISAAFIGPGTVTTAGKAGAAHGLDLLWALLFSILATIVLQEAAARITLASDRSLGEIISLQFANARWLRMALFLAVAFGCAAYQAGNLLGALSGLELLGDIHYYGAILLLGSIAFMLLWWGNIRHISTFLALIVAGMGLTFFWVALQSPVSLQEVVTHSFQVQFPKGSSLLIIGLIGTTIVPYNLFLASGISHSQSLGEMRWGLITSILLGGIISAAVVVVGTEVSGIFSFPALADRFIRTTGFLGRDLLRTGTFRCRIEFGDYGAARRSHCRPDLIGKSHDSSLEIHRPILPSHLDGRPGDWFTFRHFECKTHPGHHPGAGAERLTPPRGRRFSFSGDQ
jgi:manganese transport protein